MSDPIKTKPATDAYRQGYDGIRWKRDEGPVVGPSLAVEAVKRMIEIVTETLATASDPTPVQPVADALAGRDESPPRPMEAIDLASDCDTLAHETATQSITGWDIEDP